MHIYVFLMTLLTYCLWHYHLINHLVSQKERKMPVSVDKRLNTKDGHSLSAHAVSPDGPEIGGIILLHEIFGVTAQMQELAKHFASIGYKTMVPSLFDRIERDINLNYDEIPLGKALADASSPKHLLLDIQAAVDALDTDNIALVGYCWGGGIAYFAACHLQVDAGVAFYGTRLPDYLNQQPICPFQFHFGEKDNAISTEVITQVRAVNNDSEIYIYKQAGHAFANCARPSFHAASAALAEQRLLDFLSCCRR